MVVWWFWSPTVGPALTAGLGVYLSAALDGIGLRLALQRGNQELVLPIQLLGGLSLHGESY